MHHRRLVQRFLLLLFVASFGRPLQGNVPPNTEGDVQGYWSGSWGGGERGGAVFQPVIAKMAVRGNRIAISGFPKTESLLGTVRIDHEKQVMLVKPDEVGANLKRELVLTLSYQWEGERLRVSRGGQWSLSLTRTPTSENPLGNVRLELVSAAGINDAGELLVTEFSVIQFADAGKKDYKPTRRRLSIKSAQVGLISASGWRTKTVDQARELLGESQVVAVIRRPGGQRAPVGNDAWTDVGRLENSNRAILRTLSKGLRQDMLVFILAPQPVPLP